MMTEMVGSYPSHLLLGKQVVPTSVLYGAWIQRIEHSRNLRGTIRCRIERYLCLCKFVI